MTEISSWAELAAINTSGTTLADDYILTADLDSSSDGYSTYASSTANSGAGWIPIGTVESDPFLGTFDGNGHTISDIYITNTAEGSGLFGFIEDATIRRLGIVNITLTSSERFVGGLVGDSVDSTIVSCYCTGSVTGTGDSYYIGGLAGYQISINSIATIHDSYSQVSVDGTSTTGGFIGMNYRSVVFNCYSAGSVSSDYAPSTGGFCGDINIYEDYRMSNNFYDATVCGLSDTTGATGKTTAQMKDIDTFTEWDIYAQGSYSTGYWKIDDGNAYPLIGDYPPEEANITSKAVVLNDWTYFPGSQFFGYSDYDNLNSGTDTLSMRFRATYSGDITAVCMYVDSITGTSPTYKVSVQGHNATTGGPDGNILGYATVSFTATAWWALTLNTSVTLTAGAIYHIVTAYDSGTCDSSNYASIRYISGSKKIRWEDSVYDPSLETLFSSDSGTNWSVNSASNPMFCVDYADRRRGVAVHSRYYTAILGANYEGEYFTMPDNMGAKVTALSLYVYRSGTLLDDLYYKIEDSDHNELSQGVFVAKESVSTGASLITKTFPSAIDLQPGAAYKLILYSPDAGGEYRTYVFGTLNTPTFLPMTFGGESSYNTDSTDSGANWSTSSQYDLYFAFTKESLIEPPLSINVSDTSEVTENNDFYITDIYSLNTLNFYNSPARIIYGGGA